MKRVTTQERLWSTRWTTEETRDLAVLLTIQIRGHEAEISSLKIALDAVQDQCKHKGREEYRGYQVGTCSICQQPSMTKSRVDEIFST
ncbi:MAG: hypothetical protein UW76_C0018G0017 [Parcubacteria group bacterium GW2011_GWF2_44_8b]|nr:MAG: hypothetical protein UV94_C0007G0019 [Parcubacteria group bacterium GW2011_GWC1_43_30]KKT79923.1 MAG: hypothetical protein UW76_C0018G0017 [Parcubacteria group bacterium GW2011_GWF2_44_8b]